MAARVGAGTGVIVSLVVFVLTTIFLLVLAIVFYSGKLEAEEKLAENKRNTSKFVRQDEQAGEWIKAAEAAAGPSKSIARHQQEQIQRLMGFLTGNPDEHPSAVEDSMKRYGVGPQKSAAAAMDDLRRQLKESGDEVSRLKARVSEQEVQVSKLFEELRRRDEAHQQEIDTATASIAEYRTQAQKLFAEVEELKGFLRQEGDRDRERYEGEIARINSDLDNALQESAVLRSRIKQFEARLEEIRIKAKNPAMLVDGRVVDVSGVDEVFIDRGREQRIVLGMTFEMFDDESSIRMDPVTGAMPRGKASIQVTRVNQTTSVGKVTRATAGRPIVRGDVIANAIYDPTYRFKFLMHGKFDVDGDGKATDAEAEHLRNLVIQWGGTVVTGEELPGDLDFLVLGEEPPIPPPLRIGASEIEQRVYIDRKAAQATYTRLRDQALQAQIPVLNANRFLILIGHTAR